ncbi:rhomboid family intramembrane serine protease [Anaerocolumna xylanovorans]|uniref:Membrane associated serine protease, rhomboid family n=1 Tax=Anaerocolumna xylanovorans DSM 12503 TaxID=1121345 RepID=A0A1M7YMP4_9FIRM|nr:rhomboid family intramembrane serine protease [Anaerocolumna xylanovorans]SHO53852.1 Membrane associated serine protease, rhomboid family [Anaerocolumna xylanovorans DSM 12503]
MIIDDIKNFLVEKNLRPIAVNAERISLYYQDREEGYYALLVLDCPMGSEFTAQQYQNIKRQIYESLVRNSTKRIYIHTILVTENTSAASRITEKEAESWIIDTGSFRLIIYENQRYDFIGIRRAMEDFLLKEYLPYAENEEENMPYEAIRPTKKSTLSRYFSPVNTSIVLLNILVFLVINTLLPVRTEDILVTKGALSWRDILENGEYYRLATYMFLHSGTDHLTNNMIVLLFIGDNLERAIGRWKYLIVYLGAGILAGGASILHNMIEYNNIISIGASGAIFGVVGAMAYIVIANRGRLENISTAQLVLFVIFSLYGGLTSQGVDNAAHIGGLISGFILAAVIYRRQKKSHIGMGGNYED